LPKAKKINGLSHINPTVISNKFHINLQVPSGYAYVLQKQFYVVEKRLLGATPVFLIKCL
jgi:hypothetical protein